MRYLACIGLLVVACGAPAGGVPAPSAVALPTVVEAPSNLEASPSTPVVVVTAAPDAGGPLNFENCPTLAEAAAAVPAVVGGPDANAVTFKTMVLQCIYAIDGLNVSGGDVTIAILVFDASAEGIHLWDMARADFPHATDLPELAEVAFTTGDSGHEDLWVVQGKYGFHMFHTRPSGIPLDQWTALARAMLTGLSR